MSAIQLLTAGALGAANARYAAIGFALSEPARDRTFGLLEQDVPIALGRIQAQGPGELEIGGFWVAEEHRGRGLARRLVAHVLARLPPGTGAWCIPFEHLEGFYRSFGMRPVARAEAPPAIRAKLGFCATRTAASIYGAGTILLRYDPRA